MSLPKRSIPLATAMILVIVALVLAAMRNGPNPGGNTTALAACNQYLTLIESWAADHPGKTFELSQADPQTRAFLARLPRNPLIGTARLLARLDGVRLDPTGEERVIMVCDRAYDNVPQRMFGKSPMAHAAAYSTGVTRLITPEAFSRLDLSGFIDLQSLSAKAGNPALNDQDSVVLATWARQPFDGK